MTDAPLALGDTVRVAVIGGGVMGRALCEALLAAQMISPDRITVAEPDPSRRAALETDLAVGTCANPSDCLPGAEIVILAIKPQIFPSLALDLHGAVPDDALLISIMAGVTVERISQGLSHDRVVRAMPNAAARLRRSMTVWYAAPTVTDRQWILADAVLSGIGEAVRVPSEDMLDLATAVSGSGPAYLALVAEALIEGAVSVGFARPLAQTLVAQTFAGTAALLQQPGAHPTLIRESVTSPGGTTAAGLQTLESRAVRAAFAEAVGAGLQRARELGRST